MEEAAGARRGKEQGRGRSKEGQGARRGKEQGRGRSKKSTEGEGAKGARKTMKKREPVSRHKMAESWLPCLNAKLNKAKAISVDLLVFIILGSCNILVLGTFKFR